MTRRCRSCFRAISLGAAVLVLAAVDTGGDVPSWIPSGDTEKTGRPLWVAAEEAAPNGFLRWELFDPDQQAWYREVLDRGTEAGSERPPGSSPEGCTSWLYSSGAMSEAWSPQEILGRASVVYVATVEDAVPGFFNGNIGTMIHASVLEVLQAPPAVAPLREFFVFYPYAEIQVEGGYLCSRDLREPALPKIRGILILAPLDWQPDLPAENIYSVDDTEYFFDTATGELSAPFAYGKQPMEASALLQSLRAAARSEEGP